MSTALVDADYMEAAHPRHFYDALLSDNMPYEALARLAAAGASALAVVAMVSQEPEVQDFSARALEMFGDFTERNMA